MLVSLLLERSERVLAHRELVLEIGYFILTLLQRILAVPRMIHQWSSKGLSDFTTDRRNRSFQLNKMISITGRFDDPGYVGGKESQPRDVSRPSFLLLV